MNGSYLFRVSGLPPEWMLAAVTLNGKPFLDTPLPVAAGTPDAANIQLVVSRKGGRVEGQVVDSNNNATGDATVVLFSADAARWTIASRFVHAARPDNAGRFSVSGLPAGAYRAVAREFVPEGQWEDPEFLAGLVAGAARVDVGEAETATVTLKVQQ